MLRLSICIATYNRAAFIARTLESIIPQLVSGVELLVVDGASTDNTQEVVKHYAQKCRRLRYVRLSEKGGVDRDYCKAVEIARSEYVWLFSDDDMLGPGAVARILEETRKRYSLIIVNAKVMDSEMRTVLTPAMLGDCSRKIFKTSELDDLFECIVPYVSFIGSVVISRSLWLQRNTERYIGTEFVHVGVIFQAPLPGLSVVLGEPLIAIRYGNAQWSTRASSIWLWTWPRLLESFEHVSAKTRRRKTNPVSWKELKKIVVYRSLSSFSYDVYRKFFLKSAFPVWWKAITLIVALFPASILKVALSWYLRTYRMHKKETRMTLLDLATSTTRSRNTSVR
ncbi:MAG TPA: glycosyltransferase family 2 protein [Bacteroidota bacterium]